MNRKRRVACAEVAVPAPAKLRRDLYEAGYAHGLRGGQLDRVAYFKLSFREGFRAAKLALRARRRREGLLEFPLTGRMKMKAL
jgi:hypothetical protein